jgi:hypothetical protein
MFVLGKIFESATSAGASLFAIFPSSTLFAFFPTTATTTVAEMVSWSSNIFLDSSDGIATDSGISSLTTGQDIS